MIHDNKRCCERTGMMMPPQHFHQIHNKEVTVIVRALVLDQKERQNRVGDGEWMWGKVILFA